ncbi:protein VARIATION IN COMPOUND TRIGGERED ROOT growth response-like [Gossypium australe]|uniref:Protein VARIATION IN COMPOUND TRIGGERED ROOT growth response-like n=1 Tax=Gossypium australe TaxID=47621 RepID=A0A5B6WL17_9ROSI|nr:protein VARIATION IN COMPOUND TRIGGERED ROOT growth response-like [Gossypium australe]
MDKLKEYIEQDISKVLRTSFDELDEQEQNIFLDIAIFFKGETKENVEEILSSCYNGAKSSISNLVDKCLLDIYASFPYREASDDRGSKCISMHDMLEQMGKDIVRKESKYSRKRSRLWNPNEVNQVLTHNTVRTELIGGIKLDMSQIGELLLRSSVFENMLNLRYIHFYFPRFIGKQQNKKLHADQVGNVSLPDELRLICWEYYPFKSLSNFDLKNLVVLKLPHSDIEQLWNEDDHQDLINLRKIVLSNCMNLKKIPYLLGAINLETLCLNGCNSLVELPNFTHLASLKTLHLRGCYNLKKFPELPNGVSFLDIEEIGIEEVPDSIEHIAIVKTLFWETSKIKNIWGTISELDCGRSEISASKFKNRRMDSSLKLKITPNEFSGSRFLSFAICLVVDLTHCHKYNRDLGGISEYQLTTFYGSSEKFECAKVYVVICLVSGPAEEPYALENLAFLERIFQSCGMNTHGAGGYFQWQPLNKIDGLIHDS